MSAGRPLLLFASVGIGIAVCVAGLVAFFPYGGGSGAGGDDYGDSDNGAQNPDPLALDFDYSINSDIAARLSEDGIAMSSPIEILEPSAIERYCTFFADAQRQAQVEHCTSTEILDARGAFLGNIHMIGTAQLPKLVIVVLEVSSGGGGDGDGVTRDAVVQIFDAVIDTAVCRCWEQQAPGGFSDVSAWADGLGAFHRDAPPGITTKSSVIALDGKKIQAELTGSSGGGGKEIWKLFVAK